MVSNCPTDNDYAVAMDPRLRTLALKLCVGVIGASSQEEVVWATVRDLATQHWKFEKDAISVYGGRRRFWRRPEGCS